MKKIVICGNYGATNLGDEAILDGIVTLVRQADPAAKITVMSANPPATASEHNVESVALIPCGVRSFFKGIFSGSLGKTFDAIKSCDAVILGGGGLFADEKMMAIVIWSLQNAFFRLYKKPVFCLGQSVGPLNTFFGRFMTRRVYEHCELATVRDTASQKLLHGLRLPLFTVLADPAFALHSLEPTDAEREKFVVISVRPWVRGDSAELYKILAQFIFWLHEKKNLKSVLVPFQLAPDDDSSILNKILIHVESLKKGHQNFVQILDYTSDYRNVIELISRAKAVVGMRLHSLIFSVLTETPFLALSYSSKITAFLSDLELSDYCLKWEDVTLEDLKKRFEALTANDDRVFMRLNAGQMTMRAKVKEHGKFLQTFLGQKEQ
jgi:polysaccharide pyruvyl transferase CsaB